ncbi:MAG: 30S ribosomal protein S8 [Candidatus Nezhaarchaeota archaeon]|nr:30S ribosomal protein S8 [Candidatus Nezhaarchaeota archaeon]
MTMTDVLSDALARIMNSEAVGKSECLIVPASKLVASVLKVLLKAGYIGNFEYIDDGRQGKLKVQLLGRINQIAAIRPRRPVRVKEFEEVEKEFLPSHNIGLLILSTSRGIVSHVEAKRLNIGGVLLAYVY